MTEEQRAQVATLLQALTLGPTADGRVNPRPVGDGLDLAAFLLANLPYGVISADALQQGLIEIDGPASRPLPNNIPPLYWYFAGRPHEIAHAIHIQYTYTKPAQTGLPEAYGGSIFVGYEILPDSPDRLNQAADRPAVAERSANQDDLLAVLTSAVSEYLATRSPGFVAPQVVSRQVAGPEFYAFVKDNMPERNFQSPGISNVPVEQGSIEYDGIAREYNSVKPFPYNLAELVREAEKYDQLLYWYFGGRAYRITKAMRLRYESVVPLARANDAKSRQAREQELANARNVMLLVGYQGPSM